MPIPGAIPETVYIHSEDVSDVTYVSDRARVKVKAIGALTRSDIQTLHKVELMGIPSTSDTTSAPVLDLSGVNSMHVCW